ncbi:MAG: hypothetical protein AAGL19_20355, partial [Pseudomonadota bacterium]
ARDISACDVLIAAVTVAKVVLPGLGKAHVTDFLDRCRWSGSRRMPVLGQDQMSDQALVQYVRAKGSGRLGVQHGLSPKE